MVDHPGSQSVFSHRKESVAGPSSLSLPPPCWCLSALGFLLLDSTHNETVSHKHSLPPHFPFSPPAGTVHCFELNLPITGAVFGLVFLFPLPVPLSVARADFFSLHCSFQVFALFLLSSGTPMHGSQPTVHGFFSITGSPDYPYVTLFFFVLCGLVFAGRVRPSPGIHPAFRKTPETVRSFFIPMSGCRFKDHSYQSGHSFYFPRVRFAQFQQELRS